MVYTSLWCVYQSTYAYILFSKQFEKICITAGFKPKISCILSVVIATTLQSINTSVLQMSVTRLIFNRSCSPSSRHLAAGVGHPAQDQLRRQRQPWHRRPGPPLRLGLRRQSPGPGTLAPTGRQFWSRLWQCSLTEVLLRNIWRLLLASWQVKVQ
jgi:hypothetical protein